MTPASPIAATAGQARSVWALTDSKRGRPGHDAAGWLRMWLSSPAPERDLEHGPRLDSRSTRGIQNIEIAWRCNAASVFC